MPSIVWCDRAKYKIAENQSEATQMIEDLRNEHADEHFEFVWFTDFLNDEKQVALRIDKISAVEKYYPT